MAGKTAFLIVLVWLAAPLPQHTSANAETHACDRSVSSLVNYVVAAANQAKDEQVRDEMLGDSGRRLVEYVRSHRQCWQRRTVDKLATLLSHPDDSVRMYATHALAIMGPRAKSAVPALEKALAESDEALRKWVAEKVAAGETAVLMPQVYVGRDLRRALERITGKHVPEFPAVGSN